MAPAAPPPTAAATDNKATAAAVPSSSKPSSGGAKKADKKKEDKKKAKPKEYNPHWRGYTYVFLSSLINLSACCNVSKNHFFGGSWDMAVAFGCVTFALSFLIIFFDRTKWFSEKIGDFNKAYDGHLEGGVLICFVLWWIIGVSYQTQVNGIAYLANNVYFSSWMTLGSSVYTLNHWSTEKDILSISELTCISETLPSWYVLMLGSLVVLGTNVQLLLKVSEEFWPEASLGIALGTGSFFISFIWILVHYNFIERIQEGGWLELGAGFSCILIWIVGVSVMTQQGGVAATLTGSGCNQGDQFVNMIGLDPSYNCTISYTNKFDAVNQVPCSYVLDKIIPGSNNYAGLWLCMGASLNIAFKWKQQQARNFAQAQAQTHKTAVPRESVSNISKEGGDEEEDDDDDDDFQDADVY